MMLVTEFWIILAVFCLLGELITNGFFLLWFGISALIAALLSYFGFDPILQFAVFILLSLVLLVASRPLARKISHDPTRKAASDRLIGKDAVVIREILPPEDGMVKVDGDVWKARSSKNIKEGEIVTIKSLDSVKVVVEYKGGMN